VGFSEDDALLFWFLLDLKKNENYQNVSIYLFAKIGVREKIAGMQVQILSSKMNNKQIYF
jgi:hypothetical protein